MTRRRLLARLAAAPALLGQQRAVIFDLLLKNGQVFDPRNNRRGRLDIGVAAGKIVRVGPGLPAAHARLVVEAGDYYVAPGLIDLHAHYDALGEDRSVQPDHNALPHGVTTAVDMGGTGPGNFEAFERRTVRAVRTRVLAWLNAEGADAEACAAAAKKFSGAIVGFAARSPQAVAAALQAAARAGLPVMAEGTAEGLRPGDLATGIFAPGAAPLEAARRRGVLLDSGRLWFRLAAPAVQRGFLPDTISTDIQKDTVLLERANMTATLSKFLNLGLTLEQALERVTVNAARAIRRADLGHLGEGAVADIVLLEVQKGKFGFVDGGRARMEGDRRLRCVLTVRAGRVVWDSEGLSLTEWTLAGPYSNFK